MSASLLTQKCWNHGSRPAVVRCPDCGRYFCRECVTEHDGRMMCAPCVRAEISNTRAGRSKWLLVARLGHALAGVFVAWLAFVTLGRLLVGIPASVHEGTVWSKMLEEDQP